MCFWPLTVSCCMTVSGQLVRGRSRWLVGRGGWTKSQGRASGQQGALPHSCWAGHSLLGKYCSGCSHSPSAHDKRIQWHVGEILKTQKYVMCCVKCNNSTWSFIVCSCSLKLDKWHLNKKLNFFRALPMGITFNTLYFPRIGFIENSAIAPRIENDVRWILKMFVWLQSENSFRQWDWSCLTFILKCFVFEEWKLQEWGNCSCFLFFFFSFCLPTFPSKLLVISLGVMRNFVIK